jgi:hypothetical protein
MDSDYPFGIFKLFLCNKADIFENTNSLGNGKP